MTKISEKEEWHSYIPDKKGNLKKYSFWYRGRIYELEDKKVKMCKLIDLFLDFYESKIKDM